MLAERKTRFPNFFRWKRKCIVTRWYRNPRELTGGIVLVRVSVTQQSFEVGRRRAPVAGR